MLYQEYLVEPVEWSFGFGALAKRIALITGILIGISPSPSHSASAREDRGKKPVSQNNSAHKLNQARQEAELVAQAVFVRAWENGATKEQASRAAGVAAGRAATRAGVSPVDAGHLAAGVVTARIGSTREAVETAVYAVREAGGSPSDMGQSAGNVVKELVERLANEIEEAERKITGLRAVGASVPQELVNGIYENRSRIAALIEYMISAAGIIARRAGAKPSQEGQAIGAALREIPEGREETGGVSYESRIRAYLDTKGGGLSPRDRGILTGNAMLAYERNWEFVAKVAGNSVFESGGSWSDMESVIMSIFKEYAF